MQQVVLITITGPDPKLVKVNSSVNASTKDGQTSLSCSGPIHFLSATFLRISLQNIRNNASPFSSLTAE